MPETAPEQFIGAAADRFAPTYGFRPVRLAKKVAAVGQFIQTQSTLNVARFREYVKCVVDEGLREQTGSLPGRDRYVLREPRSS